MEWFKQNADYYIGMSDFTPHTNRQGGRDLSILYQIYNNQFPLKWFTHITDPLNAQNPQHRNYPAKIRPTGMLRTNIDLLLGEYPKRPFVYQVVNLGEDAYNSYLEGLSSTIELNLKEHFLAEAQNAMKEAGHEMPEVPQDQEIEMPDSVKERFTATYKDNLSIRGQKWMKRAIREYRIRQQMLKMMKDWLITGEAYSYKNIENGNLVYERVSPLELDYDKSPGRDFVEDGEWVIRRQLWTISDVVDHFYDELKDADYESLETRTQWATPASMFNYLNGEYPDAERGKIPVYHITWKGRKPIRFVTYTDPLTGETQEMTLDEDTPLDPSMQLNKTEWVNEVYEAWRIGDDIYTRMRPIPVQRNQMNNFSYCKLPYNGRKYSDTHADNISVLSMGIPYAIMYMICDFKLEKTIGKNKDKITLIDQNAIPQKDGWDEEKFFYYADALGYMIINRNQIGVDKSMNQYHVLDMSLWEHIKNLIELKNSFKQGWDDLLGITPPRKGQIAPSDGLGTTQSSLFQSSVITDMIFTLFEEFTETDLQGLLDYSRFTNVDGIRSIYNEDDFDRELLDIDPNSYCSAELGLFVEYSAKELQTLQQYKAQVQAMIQNGVRQSTILEIQQADNVSELMAKLKQIEEMEIKQAQIASETEHNRAMEIEKIKEEYAGYQSLLKINEINAEWDRRDQNEMVKGEYTLYGFGGDGDNNDNGIPDATEISKRVIAQQQALSQERMKAADIAQKDRIHKDQMKLEQERMKLEREKLKSKERIEDKKARTALKNRVVGEKRSK